MSNRNSDQRRRRVDGNVSMTSFAHRKGGHDRAIQEFRKRKERKFSENAKQLRQYRKVMKQEGYDAGKGASRKRSYDSNNDDDANEDVVEDDTQQTSGGVKDDQQPPNKKQRRPAKTNPFQKSLKKAQQKKLDQEAIQKEKERQEKQKQQKLRDRRKMTKKLGQRSKKGQPIIKNMAHNLLKKLEKQNQAS